MKKKLYINGMKCMHCVKSVQDTLKGIEGISDAKADLEGKYAVIELTAVVSDDFIKNTLDEEGYQVTDIEILG